MDLVNGVAFASVLISYVTATITLRPIVFNLQYRRRLEKDVSLFLRNKETNTYTIGYVTHWPEPEWAKQIPWDTRLKSISNSSKDRADKDVFWIMPFWPVTVPLYFLLVGVIDFTNWYNKKFQA